MNQELIIGLIFGCLFLSPFVNTKDDFSYNSVQSVIRLNGGTQTQNQCVPPALEQTINRREMLRKHFPDWEERMAYQEKQVEFYKSALRKKKEIIKLRMIDDSSLYSENELDSINYFKGKGCYARF